MEKEANIRPWLAGDKPDSHDAIEKWGLFAGSDRFRALTDETDLGRVDQSGGLM